MNRRFNNNRNFDPVVEEENATPWHLLKEGATKVGTRNVEDLDDDFYNEDREQFMQTRERNYREFVIEGGKKKTTKWESFSDVEDDEPVQNVDQNQQNESDESEAYSEKPFLENKTITEKKSIKKAKSGPKNNQSLDHKLPNHNELETIPGNKKSKKETKSKNKSTVEKVPKLDSKSVSISKDNRKANKNLKTNIKFVKGAFCMGCREEGHLLKHCSKFKGADICIKCGSTDHKYKDCQQIIRGDSFQFATCFICKNTGHIARQCPDNKQGVYPNSGNCRYCSRIDHLAKDCPKMRHRRRGRRQFSDFKGKRAHFDKSRINKKF